MTKFNTTTVMLLNEDIQVKQQNATSLMLEDIENALQSAEDNTIEFKTMFCLYPLDTDNLCESIELYGKRIIILTSFEVLGIDELTYEGLHTVYEVLKDEGYFKE